MEWMQDEILKGLQKLMFLSLDRTPAMDTIDFTAGAWMEALTHGRTWNEERDTPRIRHAFSTLLRLSTQWPSPSKFLDALPAIQEKPALPARIFTEEERKRNIHELADLVKAAFP